MINPSRETSSSTSHFDPQGVGICLSGGGYRAMLFHAGALRRLCESGWLRRATRISAVSGGSIAAAKLGVAWGSIFSDDEGHTSRYVELVEKPLMRLAGVTIDVPAVLSGPMRGGVSRALSTAYDKHLFHGRTLQDLPDDTAGPRFILLATNVTTGSMWRFSRPYMRDWQNAPVAEPNLKLSRAVAASSAFPPFLSPSVIDVKPRAADGTATRQQIHLTDGGVFDNLGLEPIIKRCGTVLVSDGGGTFAEPVRPAGDWLRATLRTLALVDAQVRRLRKRQLLSQLTDGSRSGAYWGIATPMARYLSPSSALSMSAGVTETLALTPTRLARLPIGRREALVNWGYAVTDAALRTYVDADLPQPSGLPYPRARED
jgi:NTE family protein